MIMNVKFVLILGNDIRNEIHIEKSTNFNCEDPDQIIKILLENIISSSMCININI